VLSLVDPTPQRAERDPGAAAAFDKNMRDGRACRIAAARAALVIDRKGHFVYEGCASFGEYGERHGVSASEAWKVLALGLALEKWPDIEEELLAGRVREEAASRMGMLVKHPLALKEGDDWLAWAKGEPASAFRRRVRERIETVQRKGAPTVEKTFYVSEKGAEDFERARVLASRKAKRVLTEGEALEEVVDHYLRSFDPLRKREGKRRMPDTATLPHRRDLPAAVELALAKQNGDVCAVPYCQNKIFLENSHRKAHCEGGSREKRNLDRICDDHHDMYHRGELLIEGPTDAPTFKSGDGRPIGAKVAFGNGGAAAAPT
jgi:hypothetical protein